MCSGNGFRWELRIWSASALSGPLAENFRRQYYLVIEAAAKEKGWGAELKNLNRRTDVEIAGASNLWPPAAE
jgi:hypothetical protein